ncbi:MAG: NAD(P)-dependent oxidoreductase, partial [Cyanobacteria bacterium P01_F01_bin.53]
MKFFITGATGFIGTHLTQALVKQGKEVTVLRNQSAALDALVTEKENLRSIKADLLDTRAMAEALRGHDVVVHLAYASRGTPEEQYRITVEGTKCVLQAATEANVQRFIHMSTASTYGEPPKDKTYTEEDPRYASLELYPSLKQEAE